MQLSARTALKIWFALHTISRGSQESKMYVFFHENMYAIIITMSISKNSKSQNDRNVKRSVTAKLGAHTIRKITAFSSKSATYNLDCYFVLSGL